MTQTKSYPYTVALGSAKVAQTVVSDTGKNCRAECSGFFKPLHRYTFKSVQTSWMRAVGETVVEERTVAILARNRALLLGCDRSCLERAGHNCSPNCSPISPQQPAIPEIKEH